MNHVSRDRHAPGEPVPLVGTATRPVTLGAYAEVTLVADGSSGALCTTCGDGIPSPSNDPGSRGYPVSSPVFDPPLLSADAARALQEYFLANADRGDDAANDKLVAEILRQIRARRASREGGC